MEDASELDLIMILASFESLKANLTSQTSYL